jgi:hypothetical protein
MVLVAAIVGLVSFLSVQSASAGGYGYAGGYGNVGGYGVGHGSAYGAGHVGGYAPTYRTNFSYASKFVPTHVAPVYTAPIYTTPAFVPAYRYAPTCH